MDYFKYNPKDENIFCPLTYQDGSTGHGLLKKYYIKSRKETICDYCEISIQGQNKPLSYFQSQKDCSHLIRDFGENKEELQKIQSIFKNGQNSQIKEYIKEASKYTIHPKNQSKKYVELFEQFDRAVMEKIIPFIDQVENLKEIQQLINEIRFDNKGKIEYTEIGNDPDMESKIIYLSLFLINLRELNSKDGDRNFDFSEELIKIVKEMVQNLYHNCLKSFDFFRFFCNILLPELTKMEGENNDLTYEELMKGFKLNDSDAKLSEMTRTMSHLKENNAKLEKRINELESINSEFSEYKILYQREVLNNEDLKAQIETKNIQLEDLNNIRAIQSQKIIELENLNSKYLSEKNDLKNEMERDFNKLQNAFKKELDMLKGTLNEKDAILNQQKNQIANFNDYQKKLKDRIHELEVHLATESEENRINLIKYENILGDYEVLLKRHEYLNSYSAEVANILNS
jgi:hypothetical protein